MASRSSCAAAAGRKTQRESRAAAVLVIFDLLQVLLEIEHDEAAVARAEDAEEELPLALLELEAGLVGLPDVLEGVDGLVADLRDDVEVGEAAGACVAREL